MAKRPPIALTPSIPLAIRRELQKISNVAFDAQESAAAANTGLATKVTKDLNGLLEVSAFASKQLQAGGKYPISIGNLPGRAGQTQAAYVPAVAALPLRETNSAGEGELVWYNGGLYRYSMTGGSPLVSPVQPGQWQNTAGSIVPGVWTPYTPTATPASGSVTVIANQMFYQQTGKTVDIRGELILRAATAGLTLQVTLSLPVANLDNFNNVAVTLFVTGTANYGAVGNTFASSSLIFHPGAALLGAPTTNVFTYGGLYQSV